MSIDGTLPETLPGLRFEAHLMAAARGLRKTYDLWLGQIGLNFTEGLLLTFVETHGPTMQSQLAEGLSMGRPATGDVVDGLARRDLVTRQSDPNDRRVWLIALTLKGQDRARRVAEVDGALSSLMSEGLSAPERAEFDRTLSLVRRNIDRLISEGAGPDDIPPRP